MTTNDPIKADAREDVGDPARVAWVGQEEPMGCVAAALAMLLRISYREAVALFQWPREEGRYCPSELYRIMERRGWKWQHTSAEERKRTGNTVPGDVCLGLVRPRGSSGLWHAVIVLRGGTVLDPSTPEPRSLDHYDDTIGAMSALVQSSEAP
jgi:hypothetical protein